jgi:PHP family Zn ribbon phosphoesterase
MPRYGFSRSGPAGREFKRIELTRECFEAIAEAARKVDNGTLTITIQVRPEDNRYFDLKLGYETRRRMRRNDADAKPEQRSR